MNHLVGDSHIIATKDLDRLATGMVKVGQIVNDSINGHLVRLEVLNGDNALLRRGVIVLAIQANGLSALPELVCVGSHSSIHTM